MGFSPVNN